MEKHHLVTPGELRGRNTTFRHTNVKLIVQRTTIYRELIVNVIIPELKKIPERLFGLKAVIQKYRNRSHDW